MTSHDTIFGDRLIRTAERLREQEADRSRVLFERGRADRSLGLPLRSLEPDYRRGYRLGDLPRPRLPSATG